MAVMLPGEWERSSLHCRTRRSSYARPCRGTCPVSRSDNPARFWSSSRVVSLDHRQPSSKRPPALACMRTSVAPPNEARLISSAPAAPRCSSTPPGERNWRGRLRAWRSTHRRPCWCSTPARATTLSSCSRSTPSAVPTSTHATARRWCRRTRGSPRPRRSRVRHKRRQQAVRMRSCRLSGARVPTGCSSIRVIVMSHPTYMSSGTRIGRSSGWIRCDYKRAAGSAGRSCGESSNSWLKMSNDSQGNGMSTSAGKTKVALAEEVRLTDNELIVELVDGRSVSVPIAWFPRLLHGGPRERENWRLIGRGEGLHWPDLDEDICVEDLLAGRGSGETQESLRRWLESRPKAG